MRYPNFYEGMKIVAFSQIAVISAIIRTNIPNTKPRIYLDREIYIPYLNDRADFIKPNDIEKVIEL